MLAVVTFHSPPETSSTDHGTVDELSRIYAAEAKLHIRLPYLAPASCSVL